MKPHLSKYERKALRFAYDLMRGNHSGYVPYVHGLILRYENGKIHLLPGYWIEPDRDPDRPYLNEVTFTQLTVRGFLECQQFLPGLPGPLWLYRLTRAGCAAMGWDWPLTRLSDGSRRPTPQERRRQQEDFYFNRRGRKSLLRDHRSLRDFRSAPLRQRHPVYRRLYK
jgi:hypothetical protein